MSLFKKIKICVERPCSCGKRMNKDDFAFCYNDSAIVLCESCYNEDMLLFEKFAQGERAAQEVLEKGK